MDSQNSSAASLQGEAQPDAAQAVFQEFVDWAEQYPDIESKLAIAFHKGKLTERASRAPSPTPPDEQYIQCSGCGRAGPLSYVGTVYVPDED